MCEPKLSTSAVGHLVHLCWANPVCTWETVDVAGVASPADTVYPVGSAVGKAPIGEEDLAFHVDAAVIIMYKLSWGLCGGSASVIKEPLEPADKGRLTASGGLPLYTTVVKVAVSVEVWML